MYNEIKELIAEELEIESSELNADSVLEDFEGWDSVMVLTTLVILSDETGVQFNPCDMKDLKTYSDIENLIRKKTA